MDFERKLKKLPRREFLKLALACLLAAGCDFENNGMTTEFPLSNSEGINTGISVTDLVYGSETEKIPMLTW